MTFGAKRAKIIIVLYFRAVYMGMRTNNPYEVKLSTHSIDFCYLLFQLKNYQNTLAQSWGIETEAA